MRRRVSLARIALLGVLALSVSSCTWAQYKFGPEHSGYNSAESTISVANVASLDAVWRAPFSDVQGSSPAVVNGTVFLGGELQPNRPVLAAFDANGKKGCTATSMSTCSALWRGPLDGLTLVSPAVVGGVAYAVSQNPYRLYAFDAAGVTGCSGTPKICTPLWTAGQTFDPVQDEWVGDTLQSSPVVANGVVYVSSADGGLFAYDAAGQQHCSGTPRVCAPLWTTAVTGVFTPAEPTVANGIVYEGLGDGLIGAYDARGTQHCAGTPKTCSPLRILRRGGTNLTSSPAVVNGVLYVGGDALRAFDVAGTTNCSGVPLTCNPLWSASTGANISASPSVANGVVYVGAQNAKFYAFDAKGVTGCSGTPKTCTPLWWAGTGPGLFVDGPAAIANGVVYVGSEDGTLLAFDAAGQTRCNTTTHECNPLWSVANGSSFMTSGAAIDDGTVYWTGADSVLRAYKLQPGPG